jgi:ABC-type Fe3+-hydroxamate transport system substrate-binding protein
VGGLFNPSLESVLALRPDLVVMVPGVEQHRLGRRLEELGIPVLVLPNITLDELLSSMQELGRRVGRERQADERVAAIRRAWQDTARDAAARPRVPALLVLQRDPLYLVGDGTWVDAMLEAAGVDNLAAELDDGFPRAAVEWLIEASPQLLLDATEGAANPLAFWSRWPSIPAVAAGRVRALPGDWIRPGPYIDRSLKGVAALVREAAP